MGGGILKAANMQTSRARQYTSVYSSFLGVDFSADPMLVDKNHSPYALNLVADDGGMPEKRPGWRTLRSLQGRINGLFYCQIGGQEHYLCHAGTKLWKVELNSGEGQNTLLASDLPNRPSRSFFLLDCLYLLTGDRYLVFNGQTIADVVGYVPTLEINRRPDGTGGVKLESANLISPWGIEEFIGDGSSKSFQLSRSGLDSSAVTCHILNTATGLWEEKTETTHFTVDRSKGIVTFQTAPPSSELVNVKITYAKTTAGHADRICKAKNCAVYNDGTVFVCGSVRGQDYRSGYRRPDYFPENGYDRVGSDENDIVGYCRLGEYLGIIKEDSEQNSTIFLRWQDTEKDANGTTRAVFYKKPGVVGPGALAADSIGRLVDEPLFLSRRGVYGVASEYLTDHHSLQNRSTYCNNRLTAEPELEKACTVEWLGRFLICVNSHCYVLESRRKAVPYENSSYAYECYYWENIPAVCFLEVKDRLYFGTVDGKICMFNTDLSTLDRFSDDGKAIPVVWSTCMDDDGQPARLKTLEKRGCVVTLKPFVRASAEICLRTEKDPAEWLARKGWVDVFDWEDIDFHRFSFDSNDGPRDISVATRVRGYRRLQFVVRSAAVNEGFGIYQITKTYRIGKMPR